MSETLAKSFHETYERLAPRFNYTTRRESAVPWEEVPEQNRKLMVAVAKEVLGELAEKIRQLSLAVVNLDNQKSVNDLHVKIGELETEKVAMIKQFNDQDNRMERQHREWSAKMDKLQNEISKLAKLKGENELHLANLRYALSQWQGGEMVEANPISTIARRRGWNPLVPGEKMIVHFNNIEYTIIRKGYHETS